MSELVLFLSVIIAYVLTNIDGLIAFVVLATSQHRRRVSLAFLVAHSFVIAASYAMSTVASMLPVHLIGWLGLVPLFLGFYQLKRAFFVAETFENKASVRLLGPATLFFALSTDTLVLLSAFFADGLEAFDHLIALGALLAVGVLLLAGTVFSQSLGYSGRTVRCLELLSPIVMMMAGIYILMDTGTDVL